MKPELPLLPCNKESNSGIIYFPQQLRLRSTGGNLCPSSGSRAGLQGHSPTQDMQRCPQRAVQPQILPSETCPGPSEREGGTGSKRRGCPELGFPFSPVSKPDALPVLHAQTQLARKSLSTRGANACVQDSGTEIPQWLFHTLILQAHSRPQK